ncbi:hypothetical protein FACS189459_5890 [Bacilli bacterium]|nr:hypothetical protein FACS189459_5890 [Bacilli bacterium]
MGISKPCIKAHGNADCEQFLSAITLACNYITANVIDEIKKKSKHEQ